MPGVFVALFALVIGGTDPGVEAYGPPPAPPTAELWLGASVVLFGPWLVLHVARLLS